MVVYKVIMTYPNGKVEEFNEGFDGYDSAKEFGDNLLGQVGHNAAYKDVLEDRKYVKPYYLISARKDGETMIVFDSRK